MASVVQQHEVQIGVRREFAAAQTADRHQGEARTVRQRGAQPVVVGVREGDSQFDTDKSGPAQNAGPDLLE